MIRKVNGEAPFQVLASNFSIGPSNEGYTLQISADGNNYSDLFTVGPDTTRMVTGVANGSFYRLSGNESEVSVNWQTQCSDGQGGGGGGTGPQGPQGPQGPAGGGGDSGQVQTQIEQAISSFSEELQDGDPIVGLAKQLYSPDGVTSNGFFVYRTTAGEEDVTSGIAELRKLGAEGWVGIWNGPEIEASYTPQGQPDEDTYVEITNESLLAFALGNVVTATSCQYVQGEWIPELPAGIEVVGDPYEAGMVNISIVTPITWTPIDGQPDEFVSVGLNSYNKDADTEICTTVEENDEYLITIKAIKGLDNGYIVYSTTSAISSCLITNGEGDDDRATEIVAGALYVVYPTNEYPYISIVTDDKDSICVHPRWSGIKDEEYEAYSETRIDLSSLPRLYTVSWDEGGYDYIDFVNGNIVRWVDIQSYDVDVLLELESNDEVYDCDGTYIYTIKDEPVITPLDENIDYTYTANDFGVEYFVKDGAIGGVDYTCYAETYYMNNLIDKLRRMKTEFVHLDNLDSNGEAGVTYEYQGRLMMWNPNTGNTAEWLRSIDQVRQSGNEGTGLIYAKIPDGQILFEFRNNNAGDYRKVVYSGNTLYLTETAGTVVCAVTVGNTFKFEATNYGNIRNIEGIFKDGYIGFRIGSYGSLQTQNVWNGSVNGGHYELIDKYNYPYLGTANDTSMGIPRWNGKGQVVKKDYDVVQRNIYVNFTGNTSTYQLQALAAGGGSQLPARIWVPTDAGTQGQILTSTGGNAPVWNSWIKSVKISSADYEVLDPKDPNTLYLIVDE